MIPQSNLPLGTLFVISAPSGAGKTSLVHALLDSLNDLCLSISHTTRPQRSGELHGQHYWFTSLPDFERMIAKGEFLEYAQVFGNFYGTSKAWVIQELQIGQDVILEIDWQGAQQIRQQFPQCVSIFILPPSRDVLRQRLMARGQDELDVIERRLAVASADMMHFREFDYLVINDQFPAALSDLQSIIHSHRLLQTRQSLKHTRLLAELLQNQ